MWIMDGGANPLMDRKVAGVSGYLSTYLPICLFICLSICLSIYLSCLSVWLSVNLFVFLPAYIFVFLSVYVFFYMSVCFSIYPFVFLSIYSNVRCKLVWGPPSNNLRILYNSHFFFATPQQFFGLYNLSKGFNLLLIYV